MVHLHAPFTRRAAHRTFIIGSAIATSLATAFSGLPAPAQSTGNPLPEVESANRDSQLPSDARFECQIYNGEYTVMYSPKSQPDLAYPWATPAEMGGGWTAENRCYTISERLEAYRPEGLTQLQVGKENGYDIVCATTEQEPGLCKIVFTVPPGQNPIATRDLVFENLTLADSGNNTTVVNTFTGTESNNILGQITAALDLPFPRRTAPARSGINLKPFLDANDGGTGTALNNRPTARPLNPDSFR
ncbi:MAG: COP23 domain-containing protein [Phormidesmis sp.]